MTTSGNAQRAFRRLALATTALTCVLVTVGAIVRVSGAGMGCPDWPTCFGMLVPPTSLNDLPPPGTYTYPTGWRVETFDPVMTWIEFLNRLMAALVGVFMLATVVAAVVAFRRRRKVLVPTFVAFGGILFAGWLGPRLVAHHLAPWMVTAQVMTAVAVIGSLAVAVVYASDGLRPLAREGDWRAARLAWLALAIALVQAAVGTQVRGLLEDVAWMNPELDRSEWVAQVGVLEMVHSTLAIVVVGLCVALPVMARRWRMRRPVVTAAAWVGGLAFAQLVIGSLLVNVSLPKTLQVMHLLCAALLIGALTTTALVAGRTPTTDND